MEHILIVEDDLDIANAVKEYLYTKNYTVTIADNGKIALDIVNSKTIDLAIVDIMMPVMDGITFVMNLRKTHDFPVIMLSAKSEETDKILGLDLGADDYITKPFRPLELLARINSQLRRQRKRNENYINENQKQLIIVGGLTLNDEKKTLLVDGEIVKLTPTEFKILNLMMKRPGVVFSAEEIYEQVWDSRAINTDTIMVHVRKIREKIEIDSKNPQYLKVVWGVGYKIEGGN